MTAIRQQTRARENGIAPRPAGTRPLQIVMCPPELVLLQRALRGEPSDATHIIQRYVARGLAAAGHQLTFVVPVSAEDIICTAEPLQPLPALRTWTDSRWFDLAGKATWWGQRRLGIPYLNVFSNYRLYDAAMQCLPGKDLVYERNTLYRSGVAKACKRLGLPYVLYVEADDLQESDYMGAPITGVLRRRARAAAEVNLAAADCVICVSEPLKRHLNAHWGVPAERIVVFPNVADVARFRPDPETAVAVRTSLGIGEHPLIMFVGNFYEWHDVTTLLEAFALVLRTAPEARLVLVGDGARRAAMMQRAAELGLADAVTFTGLVAHDAVPRYLAAADIAVVPYPQLEADLWLSPLKLFEYMASGTAVVASAVGHLTQVICHGENGLLVPPGDAPALAAALQRLITDTAVRERLGRQAREDAVRQHSWDHYLSRLEQLFQAVVDGRPVSQI